MRTVLDIVLNIGALDPIASGLNYRTKMAGQKVAISERIAAQSRNMSIFSAYLTLCDASGDRMTVKGNNKMGSSGRSVSGIQLRQTR
jgi:hypothetical protein